MKIREEHVKLPDITLNVASSDNIEGVPVLLLHGCPDAWFVWERLMIKLIHQGFRVIAPDQRGYHLSDKPKGVKYYHTENLVKDAIDLMDYFGYQKFYLVGHDFGAYISWIIGIQFPEKVEKLVILGGLHPTVVKNIKKLGWKQWIKSWYFLFFRIKRLPEWLIQKNNNQFLRESHSKYLTTQEVERYQRAWSEPYAIESMLNWYRVPIVKVDDPYLAIPVLILWGEKDNYLTVDAAKYCARFCSNGQLIIFPETDHWLMLQETERTGSAITAFFEQ